MSESDRDGTADEAQHAAIAAAIRELPDTPAGTEPAEDWEQRMLAKLGLADPIPASRAPVPVHRKRARLPRRWVAAALAAAAGVAAVLYDPASAPTAAPVLAIAVAHAAGPHRGASASVDDVLLIAGDVDGRGELRVYDETEHPIARCATPAPGCIVARLGRRTSIRLLVHARTAGTLTAILFSEPPLPPSVDLSGDLAAADRAGIVTTRRVARVF